MIREFGQLSGFFTAPARGGDPSSLIVIMHGWGADASDLADLAYPISVRFPGAAFFVPNAPDACSMNPMGRQWFDLGDVTDGPQAAARVILPSVQAACDELGLDSGALALTGFSQGGMMSCIVVSQWTRPRLQLSAFRVRCCKRMPLPVWKRGQR